MHDDGWFWSMGGMMLLGWLLLALIVVGAVWLAVSFARRPTDTHDSARRILAERYARGELDAEEYQRRLTALR